MAWHIDVHCICVYWLFDLCCTSHPASKASLKKPSEIECLAADSESLIWFNQYEAEVRRFNLVRVDVLEMSEIGVLLLPWPKAFLPVVVSVIGIMLPPSLGLEVAGVLAGIESLLGGLALPDLSLPEKSRTLTLLLTLEAPTLLPLKRKCYFLKDTHISKIEPPDKKY